MHTKNYFHFVFKIYMLFSAYYLCLCSCLYVCIYVHWAKGTRYGATVEYVLMHILCFPLQNRINVGNHTPKSCYLHILHFKCVKMNSTSDKIANSKRKNLFVWHITKHSWMGFWKQPSFFAIAIVTVRGRLKTSISIFQLILNAKFT